MKVQRITFIGILIALSVAGGFGLYFVSRWLPIPGGKFLALAPYVSLIMVMALLRLGTRWTLSLVSAVLAAVMSLVSPLMGAAIFAAGLVSDLTGQLIPRLKRPELRLCLIAALYPMYSFVLGTLVIDYMAGGIAFGSTGPAVLLAGALSVYTLGILGAMLGLRISRHIMHGR